MTVIRVVATGSELLTERANADLFHVGRRLSALGLGVASAVTVGDDPAAIRSVLQASVVDADVVIVSGGLGPTSDDVTVEATAQAFGRAVRSDPDVLARVRDYFERRGMAMPDLSQRQAAVVDGAVLLPNSVGLAPGEKLQVGRCVVYLLPGPPREFAAVFDEQVLPDLKRFQVGFRRELLLRFFGVPETRVEEVLGPVLRRERRYAEGVTVAFLPHGGLVDVRVVIRGSNELRIDDEYAHLRNELLQCIQVQDAEVSRAFLGEDAVSMEVVLGRMLVERRKTVACAESCTGGLIAHRMTQVPGSSRYFRGAVVAYSNDLKISMLGVKEETIRVHGAVAEKTVQEMVAGVIRITGAACGIAVSGIAGPEGGSAEKPVGTVWVCVRVGARERTAVHRLRGTRHEIKEAAALHAMNELRTFLREDVV